MANTNFRILLKIQAGHREEAKSGGVISPGMAISRTATGTFVQEAATVAEALKKKSLIVALESALDGKTIDDAYAADDRVFAYVPRPGDHINVLVKTGADIDVGDKLVVEGTGSGLFVEAAGTEASYQLEALEDTGGALAANTHVKCVVL